MSVNPPPTLGADEDFLAPPQQKRSIATRQQLLDAGRTLFAESGYQETSIQAITARAGAAAGAFYNYFRSKRQLLIVLMTELLQLLHGLDLHPAAGGTGLRDGLHRFLIAAFRADRRYYGVVRAWQEAALSDPELAAMQKKIEAWTNARVLGVFQLLQQHPHARANRDLPAFACMMDRHFWSILARGATLPQREFDAEVGIAADVIYHYLISDPPQPDSPAR